MTPEELALVISTTDVRGFSRHRHLRWYSCSGIPGDVVKVLIHLACYFSDRLLVPAHCGEYLINEVCSLFNNRLYRDSRRKPMRLPFRC